MWLRSPIATAYGLSEDRCCEKSLREFSVGDHVVVGFGRTMPGEGRSPFEMDYFIACRVISVADDGIEVADPPELKGTK